MRTVLFHGPSGSGKDTQVDLICEKFGFTKIGTGEAMRKLYEEGDPDAVRAHDDYAVKGIFVESELIYKIAAKYITRFDQNSDWAFVSLVRKADQIPMFDELLKNCNRTLDKFIHFTLSEEEAVLRRSLRWYCPTCQATYHEQFKPEKVKGVCDKDGTKLTQRDDDSKETTLSLLREYNKDIEPILAEYRNRGVLAEIDASPSIEEIHAEVVKQLGY
ncbi:MAG: nucleoside monophosphate kinase [Candidatus Dojkabacteria bacterium]|nr:MAG: nucleoside monophosphate kinase [Candidatus Dojkabacteria bacterium]